MGARLTSDGTLSRAEYLARWSALHGGYDPSGSMFVGRWLGVVYWCARPLVALRVPPDLVTLLGLLLAGGALGAAAAGGAWVWVAVLLVALSGLVDGLDGAVAVLTGRATPFGFVLDSVVDRVSDLAFVLALGVVGAPWRVCGAAAALMLLQEYLRARATVAGMDDVGVVTVWERPTRVVVTAMFLLGSAIYGSHAAAWAAAGAWAWLVLGVIGLAQLLVVVRRRLGP